MEQIYNISNSSNINYIPDFCFDNRKNQSGTIGSFHCLYYVPHVYIWPARGDVDYFFSKLAPKGQIADCIRIREATADKAME